MLPPSGPAYRIEDLAHHSGTSVRTIRAYQDRGLLPKAERRGRANVYGEEHLARLRQVAALLDRGYTLASIKELLEAWDTGRGLAGVLGLVAEVDGPWTDEEPALITRDELYARFGGTQDDAAVAEAVDLGVLERVPGRDDAFRVPSPQELAVAAELHAAGVPLQALYGHLRELRGQMEHIAARFLEFTTEHVFVRYLGHPPSDTAATEAAELVRRLRPLARQTVEAELARAMQELATVQLRRHLGDLSAVAADSAASGTAGSGTAGGDTAGSGTAGGDTAGSGTAGSAPDPVPHPVPQPVPHPVPQPVPHPVALPAATVRAVQELVGARQVPAFIAAATERELAARTMDGLAERSGTGEGDAAH
ncbi:MerR family transcriptional regulator [Streptomyces sp. NPDC047108]|uniref:MerR family transcriptional regulator n=1 Tax=Streptomyces sp. NPDC047108 TaxID=3155025 RepID=UPI0033C80DD8